MYNIQHIIIKNMIKTTTYSEIQSYVRKKHGRVVKSCWIAHAKEIVDLTPDVLLDAEEKEWYHVQKKN